MNKLEKEGIAKRVKAALTHVEKLAKDIQDHPKYVSDILNRVKDKYIKEGEDAAEKLIPVFRKEVYGNTLKTLDVEMLHSYIKAYLDLSEDFNIDLGLTEEECNRINHISNETILNTYIDKNGGVKIVEDSQFDVVLEKSDNIKISDNKVILKQILEQFNAGD